MQRGCCAGSPSPQPPQFPTSRRLKKELPRGSRLGRIAEIVNLALPAPGLPTTSAGKRILGRCSQRRTTVRTREEDPLRCSRLLRCSARADEDAGTPLPQRPRRLGQRIQRHQPRGREEPLQQAHAVVRDRPHGLPLQATGSELLPDPAGMEVKVKLDKLNRIAIKGDQS